MLGSCWVVVGPLLVSAWIAKTYGPGVRAFLVQDHERALWTAGPREAMRQRSIALLVNYPACSQDLNPIEIAWREVRSRQIHSLYRWRDLILRLRLAVAWVNRNRMEYLAKLCSSQKRWAKDVKKADGGKTKH